VTIDIARLPRRTLRAGTRLYRIHRRAPWHFDASTAGRFNPVHAPGRGACYWAEWPLGAFVETFRTMRTLAETDVRARSLSAIELETPIVVANLAVKRALSAGVTAAIMSGADYTASQRLASDLDGCVDGIRYRARHDLSAQHICIAWLGAQGDPGSGLPAPETGPVPDEVIDDARRLFGYVILPAP